MTRRNGNRPWAVGWAALVFALALSTSAHARAQATPPAQGAPAEQQADLYSVNDTGAPEKIRRGLFAETSVGGFITVGGQGSYSNFAPFLEIGIGYDLTKDLSLTLRFQLGPSAADCYAAKNDCPLTNTDTFTITTGDLAVSYRFLVADRLYVPVRAMGGIALLNPSPDKALQTGSTIIEPNFGIASGVEWATPFDHFTIDAEISWQFILGINASALSVYPTVRYTF
jgi:hypothetical protein